MCARKSSTLGNDTGRQRELERRWRAGHALATRGYERTSLSAQEDGSGKTWRGTNTSHGHWQGAPSRAGRVRRFNTVRTLVGLRATEVACDGSESVGVLRGSLSSCQKISLRARLFCEINLRRTDCGMWRARVRCVVSLSSFWLGFGRRRSPILLLIWYMR